MQSEHRALRVSLLAAASLHFSSAVHAQGETATQVSASGETEQVLITGFLEQDLPQTLARLGTRVDIVTSVDIENAGYIDVGQALQVTVPGLYVSPKNGPFDYVDVSLQGSRTQDVLWTVDGVRINNRLYGGTTPLDTLPASMIERIEVLEGPQALFYGTQGIAGAINIVTKDFSDTADGQISVGGDSNSGRHLDGYFRDRLGMSHFVVYGSADRSEGYRPFRDSDYQPSATDRNRGYDVLTIGGKYAVDLTDEFRFTVSEQHTDAKLDYAYPQGVLKAYNERNEDILSAKIDYRASDRLQLFVKGYYHWWYAYFTEYDNDIGPGGALTGTVSVSDDRDFWGFTDYGVNAMAKFAPSPKFETYFGYDFQAYSGNDAVLVIEKKTENVHALFGEVATTSALFPNAQFAAGFRYNAPSVGPSATVWNAMGRYDAIPGQLYVKGMVGTAFKLPTAEELFANDPNDERGNPNLKPETSTNLNASVGGSLPVQMLRWEVVGFYREIENLIGFTDFDPATNQDVFGNLPGRVRTKGAQFVLDAELMNDLSGRFSYTWSDSKNSVTDAQINRVPEQLGKMILDYHPSDRSFGLFASLNYVGRIRDVVGGVPRTYGNYAVVDVGGRVFFDMERHHRLDMGVRNLFDEEYATRLTRGFPDDGSPAYLVPNLGLPRTFYASYTYNFF